MDLMKYLPMKDLSKDMSKIVDIATEVENVMIIRLKNPPNKLLKILAKDMPIL